MTRERFDFILRFDEVLKKRLIFSRHVVQKSCSVCEGWRTTRKNLRQAGKRKGCREFDAPHASFLRHIEFVKAQKRWLRALIFYKAVGSERWWIIDFDLSYPLAHPTCFVDTNERRLLKSFRSLFFGLRDLTLKRSLILTNPGNGPRAGKGKGSWKGLNVSLSGLFSYISESIKQFGNLLPSRVLIVNDGGERSYGLIMLMAVFCALGWFDSIASYSNIPGHTHGKTDSLFGLGRKCVRKLAKRKSVSYEEIFVALQQEFPGWDVPSDSVDYGPIAVHELTTVFDWKQYFKGCRHSKVTGSLFPRENSEFEKPHIFKVSCRVLNGVSQPGIETYISGADFWQNESRFLEWTPVFRKYPSFFEIPVDQSMFSIFERDKVIFTDAICGTGIQEGSRQGLQLRQVHYYRSFCLPRSVQLADPFFLSCASFRSQMPAALLQGRMERQVNRESEESDEEEWDGSDANVEEMVKVTQMKAQKGTGGQICYVTFRDGSSRWVDRIFVPSEVIRDFQNQTRAGRRERNSRTNESVAKVVCRCGKEFSNQHGLSVHLGKTKNNICKETD